jgi:hypothetical protein
MRTIRLDTVVDAELEDAKRRWARVDDAWDAIEWTLARDPSIGDPLTEGGLARSFVYAGSYAHEMPTIQIIYVTDEHYVTIKSVRFTEPLHSAGRA